MNGCFNGKGLILTERKPAVPECEANTYREAAVLPESAKCLNWKAAPPGQVQRARPEGKGKATSTRTTPSRHTQRFSDG